MKFSFYLLITIVFIHCKPSPSHEHTHVKIVLDTEEPLGENDTIFLAGNQSELGNWNPHGLAMTRRAETRWEKTFHIDSTHVELKFTLGSFENEAISNRGVIPNNSIIEAVRDTELYFVIEDWKKTNTPIHTSFGHVESYLVTPQNGIKPRNIHVLIPDSYDSKGNIRYPVIYLHDGQNQYDANKAFIHQEWQIDENIAALYKANRINIPICVAIENSNARSDEYGDVTESNKYNEFIAKQLKPMIDSIYLTLADRKNTATMGSSLGGLVAFSLAWHYNQLFSKAACLSPAFKIRSIDMVKEVNRNMGKKKDLSLYFDNGTIGLEADLQPGLDAMKKTLESKGYTMTYRIAQGAEHNESAWAKRIEQPLVMFFGK